MKKILVSILLLAVGIGVGFAAASKNMLRKLDKEKGMSSKHLYLFLMMNQWVKVKQKGKRISDYLKKNGYSNIAIYGMSYAGETLVDELRDSGMNVAYGIDKNATSIGNDISIFNPADTLPEVDAVIVTAITFFEEVENELSKQLNCPILSLEDILYEI